jgi:hypothetical protein
MKSILAIGGLLAVTSLSYWTGHAHGYRSGLRAGAAIYTSAPVSNCYVPGEAAKPGQHPCVTIDGDGASELVQSAKAGAQ